MSFLGLNLELTMEQRFELAKMQKMLNDVPTREFDDVKELLMQATRLIMVKDNIIRELIKENL